MPWYCYFWLQENDYMRYKIKMQWPASAVNTKLTCKTVGTLQCMGSGRLTESQKQREKQK